MYGATVKDETTEFRVWAPQARAVELQIEGIGRFAMRKNDAGVFSAVAPVRPGNRYFYRVDDSKPLPDPVSRLLPRGVHGPTEIVDPSSFRWTDKNWRGLPFPQYVIYELHVGTFMPQGTFDGVRERLRYLKEVGISAIELMPVAAFPGTRNWGYDGVSIYAVQESYGGPEGLKRLVNAAHETGLAVILDVVYNHLGNEGNYLRTFGPYFTAHHKTPWGDAINYDDAACEEVRKYFVENALYWVREYHIDGLRLDATQTIKDDSPQHILSELQEKVQEFAADTGREICVIDETDENDAKLVKPRSAGGYGLQGFWSDDFHHSVHAVLTGEQQGYYQDFGGLDQIVRALNEGYVFQGQHYKYWNGRRGTPATDVPLIANVISIQNHDQVGNRAKGERLTHLAPPGAQKLAAALLLLAPHTPMLFMGEEYRETAPFQFFTDFGDPALQKAVAEGRRKEFADFAWEEVPDPQDPETFNRSKLNWSQAADDNPMLRWYRTLLDLRHRYVIPSERTCRAELVGSTIHMQIPAENPRLLVIANFPSKEIRGIERPAGKELLASDEDGYSVRVYRVEKAARPAQQLIGDSVRD